MICAEFFTRPDGDLVGFRISGHSGCGEEGNDIVCAAVSSAAYMTANTVTEILSVWKRSVAAEEGDMLVRIPAKAAQGLPRFCSRVSSFICWGLRSNIQKIFNVSYTEV